MPTFSCPYFLLTRRAKHQSDLADEQYRQFIYRKMKEKLRFIYSFSSLSIFFFFFKFSNTFVSALCPSRGKHNEILEIINIFYIMLRNKPNIGIERVFNHILENSNSQTSHY